MRSSLHINLLAREILCVIRTLERHISTLMSCKIFVVSSARLFVSICMHVVGVEWAHVLRYLWKAGYS